MPAQQIVVASQITIFLFAAVFSAVRSKPIVPNCHYAVVLAQMCKIPILLSVELPISHETNAIPFCRYLPFHYPPFHSVPLCHGLSTYVQDPILLSAKTATRHVKISFCLYLSFRYRPFHSVTIVPGCHYATVLAQRFCYLPYCQSVTRHVQCAKASTAFARL